MPTLRPRILGRTDRPVPPILWEIDSAATARASFDEVLAAVSSAGADWYFISHSVTTADIAALAALLRPVERPNVVLGVAAEDLVARTKRVEIERIDALGGLRCTAVMVQAASPSELKSGGPFHRLGTLRQQGRCDFLFAEAKTVADAEWIVESSPAHAVLLPFGIGDQTAAYRVLKSAEELGTAVIARRPGSSIWNAGPSTRREDVQFILSHPSVAMVVEPFPIHLQDADDLLESLSHSMNKAQRDIWWTRFSAEVREPAKPRGNHPPEYGA